MLLTAEIHGSIADIPPAWIERKPPVERAVRLATNINPEKPLQISQAQLDWISSLAKNVIQILSLRAGWDGPGSYATNWKHLSKLLRVLLDIGAPNIETLPRLVPLASGGVQAEWHFGEQGIEVGIASDGRIFAFATDLNGDYVVELEDTWFIPSDKLASLRKSLLLFARRVKDRSGRSAA